MSGPEITYTPGKVTLGGTIETREDADLAIAILIKVRNFIIEDIAKRETRDARSDDEKNAPRA